MGSNRHHNHDPQQALALVTKRWNSFVAQLFVCRVFLSENRYPLFGNTLFVYACHFSQNRCPLLGDTLALVTKRWNSFVALSVCSRVFLSENRFTLFGNTLFVYACHFSQNRCPLLGDTLKRLLPSVGIASSRYLFVHAYSYPKTASHFSGIRSLFMRVISPKTGAHFWVTRFSPPLARPAAFAPRPPNRLQRFRTGRA